ncbi:DEP domain-containing protein, partial [Cynara cardunculus var. scolymus]
MEKEDSTVEELVGSPAPENVKDVDAPEEEDHSIDTLTKNELSDDEMVGTPTDTNEERLEKAPEIHEEDKDVESSTVKHLLNNELEEITADGQELASGIHRVDQEIETSSKSHLVDGEIEDTATDMEVRGQEEDDSTHSSTSSSPFQLSNSKNSIDTLTGEPDIQKEGQEKENSITDTILGSTATDIEIRSQEEDNFTDNDTSSSPIQLSNSENSVDAHTVESDIQKEDQEKHNSINKPTVDSTSEEGEILDNMKDKEDREPSSEIITVNHHSGEKMEMEMRHVQEESEDEASMHIKPKDVSHATSVEYGEKIGDDLNDRQGIAENSSSEQTGDIKTDVKDNTSSKEEESSIRNGIREPEVEANSAAWPGKAAALTNFVKLKSLLAVSNVFRRLSRRVDGHNDPDDKDKDINSENKNDKEVNSSEGESQLVSQTTLEKRGWRALSFIGISLEKDQGNKAELKEVALESLDSIAMKGRVVLYTRLWCQDCKEARLFLRKRRLRYSEINIDVYPSRKLELEKITGSSDVPAVFFNQVLIGGLNELKALDESGQLKEKIQYVTTEGPSPKAPLPPFSGEDDVSSSGVVDELAVIVRNMKESIVVKDRFYKFRRITNCFLGSEAVDFLTEDQYLEREEAIEFARKLSKELFFRHLIFLLQHFVPKHSENTFEDGNHLYRFLDQDPVISQCQNIPRGIIQLKRQPLVQLSYRLKCLLYAIIDAYTSEDGKRVDYRTIHGSEEFARYLRIAEELQRVDLNRMVKEERLAFFINLYNLMAIHAILVWGHPEGALDRRRLLNDFKYVIGGCAYSLSDIHNGILRSNQRPPYTLIRPFGITDKRFKVSLPYPEPLIHFALVSGNRSAPALRCYSSKNIDVELSEAARDFLQSGAFILHLDSMTVSVTKILKWYSVDFGKNEVEVLKHASNYLEVEKTRTLLELLDSTQLKV